jgi:hypothetical protein
MKDSIAFSPDSQRIVYGAKIGEKWKIVANGAEGKAYDDIKENSIAFSPDSQRLAYGAKIGEKWAVVVDGLEERRCNKIEGPITFSPDSKSVNYKAT